MIGLDEDTENYYSEERVQEMIDDSFRRGGYAGHMIATLEIVREMHKDSDLLYQQLSLALSYLKYSFGLDDSESEGADNHQ